MCIRDRLCDEYRALLVFDEVMSGFRVAFKGAQELFNVSPDLITYAKIMGGGLPAGVYGGRKEIMEDLSPLGGVYQAGTMSGNPIVMSAGLATLNILKSKPEIYDKINYLGQMLSLIHIYIICSLQLITDGLSITSASPKTLLLSYNGFRSKLFNIAPEFSKGVDGTQEGSIK